MRVPTAVKEFVQSGIELESSVLPSVYPDVVDWETFQIGYRVNGRTGEDLVGAGDGQWRDSWWVIATNYFADPFLVDLAEGDAGRVYFAQHGAGGWDAVPVAETVAGFAQALEELHGLGDEPSAAAAWVTRTQEHNAFWVEVAETYAQKETDLDIGTSNDLPADVDMADFLTDVGPNRLKAVSVLRRILGLSLSEALALTDVDEVAVATGSRGALWRVIRDIEATGATVEFRPDPTDTTP